MNARSKLNLALAHFQEVNPKSTEADVMAEVVGNYFPDDRLATVVEQCIHADVYGELGDTEAETRHLCAVGQIMTSVLMAYLDNYYSDDALPGRDDLVDERQVDINERRREVMELSRRAS